MENLLKSFLQAYVSGEITFNKMAESISVFGSFYRYINNGGTPSIHVSINGTYYHVVL